MTKSNIIIHKDDSISDYDTLTHIQAVIRGGRISDNEKSYCYVTSFKDGITVYANKKKSDIFTVVRSDTECQANIL